MNIHELAAATRQRRLGKGWSLEEAARRAGVNRVTYKRVEDALPVRDVSRLRVEKLYALGDPASVDDASATDLLVGDLNPELADFNDKELLEEIERRMLLLASRLQAASGADLLSVTTRQDGERRVVSHTTKVKE